MKILVVEDDPQIARQVKTTLKQSGYAVETTNNGIDALHMGQTQPFDAVILDLGLPGLDGLTILRDWRERNLTMPVLILTARDTWREKVQGLRTGADDYLAKPFELEEMLARIEALIRRTTGQLDPVLECGPIRLDTITTRVCVDGNPIELTAYEYKALSYFMHHPGKVISKTELTEHIYDQDFDLDSNVIEVLINRLRKKVGARWIKTHRGQGYQLVAEDAG